MHSLYHKSDLPSRRNFSFFICSLMFRCFCLYSQALAEQNAAFTEFISNYRTRYEEFEQSERSLRGIPEQMSDQFYKQKIQAIYPNELNAIELPVVGKHFRSMILILHIVHPGEGNKVKKIRELLNHDHIVTFYKLQRVT